MNHKFIKSFSFILAIMLVLLVGCSAKNENSTTTPQEADSTTQAPEKNEQSFEWQHSSLQDENINQDDIKNLFNEIDGTDIYSAVIIRNDKIADEYFADGYSNTSVFDLHSVSKSITSTLVGIAIDKGYIKSVDTPISEYFDSIKSSGSDYQKQITIFHLLTHTSGIDYDDDTMWDDWRASENWVDYTLQRPVTSKPGTVFRYSTGNTHLLSYIVQKATGKTLYEFGKENLFEPLGMESVKCGDDAQGITDGGNGFQMTAYDMAKIGRLYLNKGEWNGERIVSSKWIDESTTVQFKRSSGTADYGYQWWVRSFGNGNHNGYFAQGHFGQYIFVVPDLSLIVVITSHHDGSSSKYWNYINTMVNACN